MTNQPQESWPPSPQDIIQDTFPIWRILIGEGIVAIIVQIVNLIVTELDRSPVLLNILQQLIYVLMCVTMIYLIVLHLLPLFRLLGISKSLTEQIATYNLNKEELDKKQGIIEAYPALEEKSIELAKTNAEYINKIADYSKIKDENKELAKTNGDLKKQVEELTQKIAAIESSKVEDGTADTIKNNGEEDRDQTDAE